MNKVALLAELRAVAETAPSFEAYDPSSKIQQAWLGKAHALLTQWNIQEGVGFRTAADQLGPELLRPGSLAKIFGTLHRAIADLELQAPSIGGGTSGPGAIYDFSKVLKELLASATATLLIVDRNLEEQAFTGYLSSVPPQVVIRLLVREKAESLKSAMDAFVGQKNISVELRESNGVHDRLLIIDGRSCWLLGQPIKVSVRTPQSYLAPLSPEVAELKVKYYDELWESTGLN